MNNDQTQYLYDVHCIEQVINHYVIGLDTRHFPLMRNCFTDDAHIEIPGAGTMTPDEYATMCEQGLSRLDATHHHIGPVAVEISGDTARARCYLTAQHVLSSLAPDSLFTIGAWYDDELVRYGTGWKISKRVGTAIWASGNPAILGMPAELSVFPKTAGWDCPDWLK